jgi:hypothetical protein
VFAVVGAFGNAILFVCCGVALVIVAFFAVMMAAHWYLVVVQGTAAGIDRVEWPDELMADWFLQAVWLVGLLLISVALAAVANRILTRAGMGPSLDRGFLLAGAALWLFFPFSLLSSLASSSRWFVFSPRVLVRLLRLLPSTIVFYLATGVLLALVLPLLRLGLLMPGAWIALPVAAALGGAVLLIHARLVGRMAWLLDQLDRRSAPTKRRKAERGKKPARRRQGAAVTDPWAAPEPDEPAPATALPGYRVVEQPVEKQTRAKLPSEPEDPDPYTMADAPGIEPEAVAAQRLALDEHKVQREVELRQRQPPNPPARPMFSGVYSFPGYPTSHKVWFWLTIWGLATLGMVRATLMFWPG